MSRCPIPLQSRFRGALLGLVLSPAVAGLNPVVSLNPSVTQTHLTGADAMVSLWDLALGLLRYHDSDERRQWMISAGDPAGLTVAQALVIGDVLALAMGGLLPDSRCQGLSDLSSDLFPYDLPAEACIQDDVVIGVLHALRHSHNYGHSYSQSYGLSVKMAAQFGEVAVRLTGFLAGAMGAQSALPVLWQLKDSATAVNRSAHLTFKYSEVIAIADRLFAQWAGVLSDVPNATHTHIYN